MKIETGEASIYLERSGSGPPLLLLHGFPQTQIMWRDVIGPLSRTFTVVRPDLRGYGQSSCPKSSEDHVPYSKRTMAKDMVIVMERLGFSRFCVAGHDRGGRVAYRMALDHAAAIKRLAVLDILPTEMSWETADARLALAFWPWSLLAQPSPLPERLLSAAPEAIVDNALVEWGSPTGAFPSEVRKAYVEALRDPLHVHAICEEYRAAATVDREHDKADRAGNRRIACPVLALWSAEGGLNNWYEDVGGPLSLWRVWADDVRGHPVKGGHFFPEVRPQETAEELGRFFGEA